MALSAFEAALPFILRWEGGFVDHPADPGGRTNRGVTQRTYDAWRAGLGLPSRDVKGIEDAEVHAVYESGYWMPPRCNLLDRPLDLVQFDTAVNMGPRRAVRFLQRAVGCGVDGDFGPGTQRAVSACRPGDALATYCSVREDFYRQIVARKPEQSVFLKGWMNRLNSLRREAGLPGATPTRGSGEVGVTRRIPDIGEDPSYDF
ncbi:MAG: glycosyl hydrolase 108 family protein [Rubrivivax sp.]